MNNIHECAEDGQVHKITNFTYADEDERLAATSYLVLGVATPFTLADVGKTAKQGNAIDGYTFWIISNVADDGEGGITVTWNSLGGGAEIVAIYQVGGVPVALSTDHFHTAIVTRADIDAVLNLYDNIVLSNDFVVTSNTINAHSHIVTFRFHYLTGSLEVMSVSTTSAHYHTATPVKPYTPATAAFGFNGVFANNADTATTAGWYLLSILSTNIPLGLLQDSMLLVLPTADGKLTQICFDWPAGRIWTRHDYGEGFFPWLGQQSNYSLPVITASNSLGLLQIDTLTSPKINLIDIATPNTLTIQTDAVTSGIPIGAHFNFIQEGIGQTTLVAAPGVTIKCTPGLNFRDQYSAITLVKQGTNVWYAFGDLDV